MSTGPVSHTSTCSNAVRITASLVEPDCVDATRHAVAAALGGVSLAQAGSSHRYRTLNLTEVQSDTSVELGVDPGLVKDGVEAHLQELLAAQLGLLGEGWRLVRREYPTPIGPVDIMCRNESGESVAVEIKRRGEIDGVEQLTRYLELLNRDPLLAPVHGIFAAQEIRPQARTLATDRGIRCVTLDYDTMRGVIKENTLF